MLNVTGLTISAGAVSVTTGTINAGGSTVTINGGTLSFNGTPGGFNCGDFTFSSGTVNNSAVNTITASGNVIILGTFNNPANSTLVMTGGSKFLTAVPQIGSLHIGTGTTGTGSGPTATITLGSDLQLAGNMEINDEGSLDVATYNITISGSYWLNRVGTWDPVDVAEPIGITQSRFEPGTRTVTINPLGSEFIIYGNNRWYNLTCTKPVQL
jgi:hypothetical protein